MKKKRSSSKKSRTKEAKSLDVNQVISEADKAVESLDMNRALSLYTAASTILKGHVELQVPEADPVLLARVSLKLGEVKVALEDEEGAREDFVFGTSLLKDDADGSLEAHDVRAGLYLYLGQLNTEQEALTAARKAIQELETCVRLREKLCELGKQQASTMVIDEEDGPSNEEALQETKRQLSNAFCTVADLYLTDLCFEQNAEQECEAAVTAAMNAVDGEPMVDSLQTMASLRLSQGQGQEAAKHILQAYAQMKNGCEALSSLVGLRKDGEEEAKKAQGAVELSEVDAANNLPGFDFRCQSAKLLMECAAAIKSEQSDESSVPEQVVECSDAAIQVLASLLAENDEVIEVWYLMGCAFAASSPPDLDVAAQYWGRALELLSKIKDHMELMVDGSTVGDTHEDPLKEIKVQIEEVRKRLKEIGHDPEMEVKDVEMAA